MAGTPIDADSLGGWRLDRWQGHSPGKAVRDLLRQTPSARKKTIAPWSEGKVNEALARVGSEFKIGASLKKKNDLLLGRIDKFSKIFDARKSKVARSSDSVRINKTAKVPIRKRVERSPKSERKNSAEIIHLWCSRGMKGCPGGQGMKGSPRGGRKSHWEKCKSAHKKRVANSLHKTQSKKSGARPLSSTNGRPAKRQKRSSASTEISGARFLRVKVKCERTATGRQSGGETASHRGLAAAAAAESKSAAEDAPVIAGVRTTVDRAAAARASAIELGDAAADDTGVEQPVPKRARLRGVRAPAAAAPVRLKAANHAELRRLKTWCAVPPCGRARRTSDMALGGLGVGT